MNKRKMQEKSLIGVIKLYFANNHIAANSLRSGSPKQRQVAHGDILGGLFLVAEVHEDFIINAPGRIGRQPSALAHIESINGLDKPNGAHGDQVVLVYAVGVVFL